MRKLIVIKLLLFAAFMSSCESKEDRFKRESDEIWAQVEVDSESKAKEFDRDVQKVKESSDKESAALEFNKKYEPYIGIKIYGFEFDNDSLLLHVRDKYKAVISQELSVVAYEEVNKLIDKYN